MDLPTYTNIWRIEKRLYKLYDFRLPMPLPVGTFGVAMGVFALWVVLLSLLNAPFAFGNGWHLVLWVVPPGVITVLATRPVIEGKRLTELLLSQARFLAEARVYDRLAPEYEPAEVRVAVRVWHRSPEAGPLPRPGRRRGGQEEIAADTAEAPAQDAPARPSRAEAPPLRGVAAPAAPEPEPVRARAEPEPAPAARTPATAPERARSPERSRRTPARKPERAPAERVPVAVAARPEPEERRTPPPQEEPGSSGASGGGAGSSGRPPRRGIGRRMLDYFGIGIDPGEYEPRREPGRPEADGQDAREDGDGFEQERVYETEGEEQRESDAWFASLRASSGETPVGLTSKSAYSVGDTAAMSRDEMADAVAERERRRSLERRRAEEVARAPAPGSGEETTAARRLRGRTQGIRVTRDLEERRSEGVRERGPEEQRPVRARGQGLPAAGEAPERPRRRDRPHAAPWELEEPGKKAEPAGYADLSDYAARFAAATGRPAAEAVPWLPPASAAPEEGRGGADAPRTEGEDAGPGRTDRDGAAAETATASAPGTAEHGDTDTSGTGQAPSAPADRAASAARGTAEHGDTGIPGTGQGAHAPARRERTASEREATDRGGAAAGPSGGKPALELDHGTGEQEAMPAQPRDEPEDRGPEWSERMSVLDQHLSTADTPAPPRPKFADAVPARGRDAAEDSSEWFEDGKRRHPDQPRVGDRGNPVIPVSELREEGAAAPAGDAAAPAGDASEAEERAAEPSAGAAAAAEEAKPPTQLDHGTGELVSFAEVREDPARGDANVRSDSGTEPAKRRTASELEAAEAAALERRREAARRRAAQAETPRPGTSGSRADGSSEAKWSMRASGAPAASGTADTASPDRDTAASRSAGSVRDPRANPSMAEALAAERILAQSSSADPRPRDRENDPKAPEEAGASQETGAPEKTGASEETGAPAGRPAGSEAADRDPQGAGDLHDGVFHRVAQNARRLGHLFGQPVPGEEPGPSAREPKPELELDHGTGEQERLGETPDGVPPEPSEPSGPPPPEEPAGDSGGTRGWRRLAKVVTGGAAPVRSDLPASDIERLRAPLDGPRSLVVLGCTGGAGQTVTALMVGHTLAAHRDDRVVAVDVNPGPNGLSRRIGAQSPETLTGLLANAGAIRDYSQMGGYTSRTGTGLEVVQTLDDPYVQTLDDRDYGQLSALLGGFYGITLLDPAATGVARALPVADGLVLVAPANEDAERAVSMTFDWLDGNGYGALRARSVLVVNGVSKRSLQAVDAAERVARGRCRAIVRIPWDDHLGSSYTRIDVGSLRPATKRAHGALGGVLVSSLTQQ